MEKKGHQRDWRVNIILLMGREKQQFHSSKT